MYYLIISFLLFSGISEAGELWTKYDLPDTVNYLTGYGEYIWAGTNNGIIRINRTDGTTKKYTINDGLPSNKVTSLYADNNGIIYAALRDVERDENNNLNAYIVAIDNEKIIDYSEVSGLRNTLFYPQNYITNESLDFIFTYGGNSYFGVNLGLWPGDNGYKYMVAVIRFDGEKWVLLYTNSVFGQ